MRFLVLLIAGCPRVGVLTALIGCDLKPASAAEITLSDLDHAQIDTVVLVDRHVQVNGQPPSSDRISNNLHLSVEGLWADAFLRVPEFARRMFAWVVVAREGQKLGYVPADSIKRKQ